MFYLKIENLHQKALRINHQSNACYRGLLECNAIFCINFKSIAVKHFNHSKVSTYKFNEIRDDITKSVLIINSNLQLIGYKKLFGF